MLKSWIFQTLTGFFQQKIWVSHADSACLPTLCSPIRPIQPVSNIASHGLERKFLDTFLSFKALSITAHNEALIQTQTVDTLEQFEIIKNMDFKGTFLTYTSSLCPMS